MPASTTRYIDLPYGSTATPNQILMWPAKDPGDTLDFTLDITGWLLDDGASTVAAVTGTAQTGITATLESSSTSPVIVFRIAGGTAPTTYYLNIQVTLSSGEVLYRTIYVPVNVVGIQISDFFQTTV